MFMNFLTFEEWLEERLQFEKSMRKIGSSNQQHQVPLAEILQQRTRKQNVVEVPARGGGEISQKLTEDGNLKFQKISQPKKSSQTTAMAVTSRDNSSFRTVTPEIQTEVQKQIAAMIAQGVITETHKERQIHEDFLEDFVQEIVDAVGCTVEEAEESFLHSLSETP
jgi:hypothetical protein